MIVSVCVSTVQRAYIPLPVCVGVSVCVSDGRIQRGFQRGRHAGVKTTDKLSRRRVSVI